MGQVGQSGTKWDKRDKAGQAGQSGTSGTKWDTLGQWDTLWIEEIIAFRSQGNVVKNFAKYLRSFKIVCN